MSKKFDCPACGAPMEYDGESSLFQNCGSCGAPIVVPSSIVERDRDEEIESTLGMPPPQVLEAESMSQIYDHLDKEEARVEEVKESGEVIDPILADSKEVIEKIMQGNEAEVIPEATTQKTSSTGLNQNVSRQIVDELRAGSKINAIKIYREHYNSSLADAKDAIENLASQADQVNRNIQTEPTANSPIEKLGMILQELQSGNKINAIKIFREQFGTGLREAKNAVEAIERGENINVSDYM